MTNAATGVRKPRPPRRKTTMRNDTNDVTQKYAVLKAALVHIPFDGFTDKVLLQAADAAGVDRAAIPRLFPKGPLGLVEVFSESSDAEMGQELARAKLSKMKVREKITLAVKTRIAVIRPQKEAARRAAAFLTLPPHAATGAKLLYRTVDSIWRAIGDTSTDFNFYTKRAILAGVYSATLMRWFNDDSGNESATEEFLAARIENVMQLEKFKAEIRERGKKLPSLSEIFSRLGVRRT
jgi:ubiquinone biosynthesis protein COQ9